MSTLSFDRCFKGTDSSLESVVGIPELEVRAEPSNGSETSSRSLLDVVGDENFRLLLSIETV